ncbi:MAG: hypothetical protein ABL927_00765 [Bdellovibrionales bacterium]
MKLKVQNQHLKNNRGNAMVETLPILIIFVALFTYSLGLFSVVHTGILNSMAARAYAFETFSNRSDVTIFRDRGVDDKFEEYRSYGSRVHTVNSELKMSDSNTLSQFATTRDIAFPRRGLASKGKQSDHNSKIYELRSRNSKGGVEVSPAWIMVAYGMCIDANCGG